MTKTRSAVALALLWCAVPDLAHATEIGQGGHSFGLGVAIGSPATGISGKYYLGGRRNAIEGVVGAFSNSWDDGWYLHGVYLWHPSVLASDAGFELPWHVGVGGFLSEDYRGFGRDYWRDEFQVGVRVPVGLDFDLTDVRLQFSGDLAANVGLAPEIFVDLSITVSIRYFF